MPCPFRQGYNFWCYKTRCKQSTYKRSTNLDVDTYGDYEMEQENSH